MRILFCRSIIKIPQFILDVFIHRSYIISFAIILSSSENIKVIFLKIKTRQKINSPINQNIIKLTSIEYQWIMDITFLKHIKKHGARV